MLYVYNDLINYLLEMSVCIVIRDNAGCGWFAFCFEHFWFAPPRAMSDLDFKSTGE